MSENYSQCLTEWEGGDKSFLRFYMYRFSRFAMYPVQNSLARGGISDTLSSARGRRPGGAAARSRAGRLARSKRPAHAVAGLQKRIMWKYNIKI